MFFSNCLRGAWIGLFSTHPPLADRIKRLDPSFNDVYPKVARDQGDAREKETAGKDGARPKGLLTPVKTKEGEAMLALSVLAVDPKNITKDIGTPLREHLLAARRLLDSLPEEIRKTASDPFGARAVIYGLLLDKDAAVRRLQMEHLRTAADLAVFETTENILPQMLALEEAARLPLMDLAMPSLRSLSLQQFRRFEENITILVTVDRRVSLFEFILQHIIVRRLEKNFVRPHQSVTEISSISDAAPEISCILSILANIGHENEEAENAFSRAAASLEQHTSRVRYMSRTECRSIRLTEVLDRLSHLGPRLKKSLISSAFECLLYDRQITMKEAEYFRLLVYALDCPLPPWVEI